MKIKVKVKARSKVERVEKVGDGLYKVWVKAVPEKGKANEAVIKALSSYLDVPKSSISIVSGRTSSDKILEIPSL